MRFLDDATSAGLGRRFRGANRSGRYRWSRTCTIFACDEPREFGYLTSGGPGDATAWHFRLDPTTTGTRLTQAFQGVSMPLWLSRLVAALIPAHDDRTQALHGDMVRLAALTEAEHQHAASSQRAPTGPSAIPAPYDIRRASERMVTVKPSPDIARCTTRLASNRMPDPFRPAII